MFLHAAAGMHQHEYSPKGLQIQRPGLIRSAFSTSAVVPILHDSSDPSRIKPSRPRIGDPKASDRVSFKEPEVDMTSEDGRSYANSDGSETTVGTVRRKRLSARTSKAFALAQPAPLAIQQKLLHIRPRLLFQLQQLSFNTRPTPVVDVLASTAIVPRLASKFPRMLKGKGELGSNDVMLFKSEDYSTTYDDRSDESADGESLAHREVIAVVCQVRGAPSCTEISLSDGSLWHAAAVRKGVFEFTKEDPVTGEKITARWVTRSKTRPHSDLPTSASDSNVSSATKYSFSILNPTLRRHPILATLTPKILDIPDQYTTVSSPASEHPPVSPIDTLGIKGAAGRDNDLERTIKRLSEDAKTLIQVTGIWVALRLGWCTNFKYDDDWTTSFPNTRYLLPGGPTRATSLTLNTSKALARADSGICTPEHGQGSFGSMGGKIMRSGTQIFRHTPNIRNSLEESESRTRAVSAGTAFMQKAAARKSFPPPGTVLVDTADNFALPKPTDEPTVMGELELCSSSRFDVHGSTVIVPGPPSKHSHHRIHHVTEPSNPPQMEAARTSTGDHQKNSIGSRTYNAEHDLENGPRRSRQKKAGWRVLASCFKREKRGIKNTN